MLLPPLRENENVELVSVATTTSLSALNAQRKFGFRTVSTDAEAVLDDDSLDAVFVVTRHSSHADLVCRALERGRTVFVEKPLALTDEQLGRILAVVEATGNDRLHVGFNRRFAPLVTELHARVRPGGGPMAVRYLVNAGRLAAGSWYLNEDLEGSRFTGEGGHFIDTVSALVGAAPIEVNAMGADGDVHAMLRFPGGSVGTISYVTGGSARFPKETIDVTGNGCNGRLDNFQRVSVWTSNGKAKGRTAKRALGQDKGQRAQLERFVEAARTGGPMPIPLADLVATTRATLAVGTSLASRQPVAL
jgi:predicted dehydrogenase